MAFDSYLRRKASITYHYQQSLIIVDIYILYLNRKLQESWFPKILNKFESRPQPYRDPKLS